MIGGNDRFNAGCKKAYQKNGKDVLNMADPKLNFLVIRTIAIIPPTAIQEPIRSLIESLPFVHVFEEEENASQL